MTRLILKILFKATIPLLMIVGVTSYSMYLRGGDPLALMGKISGGAGQQLATMVDSVKSGTRSTLSTAQATVTAEESSSGGPETLYRWVDADGSPFYSNIKPPGIEATVVKVDPNQNVIQATPKPTAKPSGGEPATGAAQQSLPGAAGISLLGGDPAVVLGDHIE